MNKEQIEEVALQVAKEAALRHGDAIDETQGYDSEIKNFIYDFTHTLLAELAKEQKPFGYLYMVNNSWYYFDTTEPPEDAYDEGTLVEVFTHPLPQPDLVAKQQAEIERLRGVLRHPFINQIWHWNKETYTAKETDFPQHESGVFLDAIEEALAATPESSLEGHDAKLVERIARELTDFFFQRDG